jgi:hypothetical protein
MRAKKFRVSGVVKVLTWDGRLLAFVAVVIGVRGAGSQLFFCQPRAWLIRWPTSVAWLTELSGRQLEFLEG